MASRARSSPSWLLEAVPAGRRGRAGDVPGQRGCPDRRGHLRRPVDALLRDSLGDYVRHEPAVQESLETGRPPFDGVKLALATHFHLDHWDAGAIARFLTNRPAALFGSPPQAGAMLPSALKPRVRPLWPAAGQPAVRLAEGGAVVDAIPLDHGMPVENNAYRLECGGRVLFHLGDSQPSEANFAKLTAAGPGRRSPGPALVADGRCGPRVPARPLEAAPRRGLPPRGERRGRRVDDPGAVAAGVGLHEAGRVADILRRQR